MRRFRLTALSLSLLAAPVLAQVTPAEHAERRAALLASLGEGVVLALGTPEPALDYQTFYQTPSFEYLTGFREPDAALVLVRRGSERRGWLFVQPRDPGREVWTGSRLGVDGVTATLGLEGRPIAELRGVLDSLLAAGGTLYTIGDFAGRGAVARTRDDQFVEALKEKHPTVTVQTATGHVERLRGTKSAAELALIRRAVDITVRAQREAMKAMAPGMNEFEIQALVEYTFRRHGADRPSFATIVGSGPNSTTLHYWRDDRVMQAGDMVVMDIGASYQGYAADVTRTVPTTGTFTAEQRAIYQAVRDAQAAAERQAKPGAPSRAMVDSATASLAASLTALGLIESPTATYDCSTGESPRQCRQLSLFYYHGLGHGIGLEVHDPEQYYFTGTLAAGSAFTIEPGLYVRRALFDAIPKTPRNARLQAAIGAAVARYADIGVRIEDDYLITAQGLEWISRAPREVAEIEALMKQPWTGPEARDAAGVARYPRP